MVDGNPASTAMKAGEPVNINYTISAAQQGTGAGSASRSVLALAKPAMMGAGLLALGTLGVGLFSMMRVPGLQDQIEELEREVDRLSLEIDVLSAENDRYEILNVELNDTLYDLVAINENLNETAARLEDSVDELNATVANLTEITDELKKEAEELETLNQEYNQTQQELRAGLSELERTNATYTELNIQLNNASDALSDELTQLKATNENLVNTTRGLNETVTQLQEQNQDLALLVADLTVIEEYFTAWGVDTNDQLQAVEQQLISNTNLYRSNTFQALNGYYSQLIQQWDCLDNVLWYDQQFFQNRNLPIFDTTNGPQNLVDLLNELNGRMMVFMCLDQEDFKAFMTNSTAKSLAQVTFNQFNGAVSEYGDNAMLYYGLPVPGSTGKVITEQQWEEASFDCKLLQNPYRWN